MGGHGGLNILPQKRWNVYGQRNRYKVHEDEVKHSEQEKAAIEKEERAVQEIRTTLLRKRTRPDGGEALEHINLFREEELQLENAETKREREEEDRKRGRKSDRTADAKFDARFAFVHGLNDSKPWYARPAAKFVEEATGRSVSSAPGLESSLIVDSKKPKKRKKKQRAKELLKELKKSKKSEADLAKLRLEREQRERTERVRAEKLTRPN